MASYDLGKTQRGYIRDWIRTDQDAENDVVRTENIELGNIEFSVKIDTNQKKRQQQCDFSKAKAFILGITLMALLAGIIVLVVKVRDKTSSGSRGQVIQDEYKNVDECHDVSVELGGDININCSFSDKTKVEGKVIAEHANPLLNLNVECKKNESKENVYYVTCEIKNANCSSKGTYMITFYDGVGNDAKVKFTKNVKVSLTASSDKPSTSVSQLFFSNGSDSKFLMDCSFTNSCASYSMKFSGRNHSLAEPLFCTFLHSDKRGNSISCQANVSKDVIQGYGNGTNLVCEVLDGNRVVHANNFELPNCSAYETIDKSCNITTDSQYECLNTSLAECNTSCEVKEECSGLVFSGGKWTGDNCCLLSWCRNSETLFINDGYYENILFHTECDRK